MKCSAGILAAAAGALILSACGQKGPLVLPDAPKHKRPVPSVPGFGRPAAPEQKSPDSDTPQQPPIDSSPTPPAPDSPTPQSPR